MKYKKRPPLSYLNELIEATGQPVEKVLSNTRKREVAMARQVIYFYLYDFMDYRVIDIARMMDRHPTTVRHGIEAILNDIHTRNEEVITIIKKLVHDEFECWLKINQK